MSAKIDEYPSLHFQDIRKLEMCQYDTDAPAQGHPHPHAGILQKMKFLKRAITLIIIGRFYPKSNFLKREKYLTHYGQVFQKVNEKVNLGRPNAHGHDIDILKDRFMKNPSKIQFWLQKLSASGT